MKTNFDKKFKTDDRMDKQGVWFEFIPETDTAFLVRRFDQGSPKAKSAMAKYYKPFVHQINNGTLDAEKEREITIKLFVHTAMIDWKNVEIDGQIQPYSPELAIQLFKHVPVVFNAVREYASDYQNYLMEDYSGDSEEVGNS